MFAKPQCWHWSNRKSGIHTSPVSLPERPFWSGQILDYLWSRCPCQEQGRLWQSPLGLHERASPCGWSPLQSWSRHRCQDETGMTALAIAMAIAGIRGRHGASRHQKWVPIFVKFYFLYSFCFRGFVFFLLAFSSFLVNQFCRLRLWVEVGAGWAHKQS